MFGEFMTISYTKNYLSSRLSPVCFLDCQNKLYFSIMLLASAIVRLTSVDILLQELRCTYANDMQLSHVTTS